MPRIPASTELAPRVEDLGVPRDVRVERYCTGCATRTTCRGNAGGVCHRMVCTECGNTWTGRVRVSELP